jgi:hypothetical protein
LLLRKLSAPVRKQGVCHVDQQAQLLVFVEQRRRIDQILLVFHATQVFHSGLDKFFVAAYNGA